MKAVEGKALDYDALEHQDNIKRVSKNAFFLVVGQLISKIFNFGYFLLLARVFDIADFGNINYVLALLMLANTVSECGLTRIVIRDVGRDESNLPAYLAALIPLRFILCVFVYGALLAIVWFGYHTNLFTLVLIGGLSIISIGVGEMCSSLLQSRQMMFYSSIGDVVLSTSQAIFGVVGILLNKTPETAMLTYTMALSAYTLFNLYAVHRFACRLRVSIDFSFMYKMLKSALPYAGMGMLIVLSMRVETLVMGWFCTSAEIGLYSVPSKLTESIMFIPLVLASSLAPVLAKVHDRNNPKLRLTYLWSVQRLVQFLLPFSLTIVICAELIILLLFTNEFRDAALLIQIQFIAFPFFSLQLLNSSVLLTSLDSKKILLLYCLIAFIQILLALYFIPLWRVTGAAISFGLSHTIGFLLTYHHIKKWFMAEGGVLMSIRAPVLAALAMALVTYFAHELSVFALAPAAIVTYAIVLFLMMKLDKAPSAKPT